MPIRARDGSLFGSICGLDPESLSHAVGDELLPRVGERLLGALRAGDTLAPLSGDEFADHRPLQRWAIASEALSRGRRAGTDTRRT